MSNPNSTTKNQNSKNHNTLYIIIFSLLIIAAILIVFLIKSNSKDTPKTNTQSESVSATAGSISIVSESGAQDAVINSKITNARDVKFSKSHTAVEKYEKSQNDTLEGDYSEATDGYSYLTYKFDTANVASFFGTSVSPSDVNSLLQYVFYNDKLIEIRIQYGSLGENAYNSIVSEITDQYGEATYYRTYSNDNKETWWKTKSVTLTAYYQNDGVSVYFRKN